MPYDPQIEYIAALSGMTPEQWILTSQKNQAQDKIDFARAAEPNLRKQASAVQKNYYFGDGTGSLEEARALAAQADEYGRVAQTQQAVVTASPYDQLAQSTADSYGAQIAQLQPWQQALTDSYGANAGARNQITANQAEGLNAATRANDAYIGGMQSAATQTGQATQGLLSGYSSALGNANAMDAATVGGLMSRDAGMQQLTAGGYGANVASDPRLVGAQQNVYDALGGFASGAYNIDSQAALAQADPEGLAAQKYTLGELKTRTDAKLTDAERAMFMQARLQREMADSANRDANFRELAQRGMGGSTMALSNLNAGSMESGVQRALTDTQAAGYAQQRAEAALRDYGTLGGQIADQSFRREFATGQAADQAAQFNVGTQMQGTIGQGNMATQMRTADDAINTFNKSQSMIQQRFQDQYAADQQQQYWQRGTDVADAQFKQSGNLAKNATDYSGLAMTELDNRYQRQADIGRTGVTAVGQYTQGLGQMSQTQMQGLRDNSSELGAAAQFAGGVAGLTTQGQAEANKFTALGVASRSEDWRAGQAASAAAAEAEKQRRYEDKTRSAWSRVF